MVSSSSALFAAVLALCLAHLATGASLTWVGPTSAGVWGSASNWNPNTIPTSDDDVTFPSTIATVVVTNAAAANSITTTGTTGITFQSTVSAAVFGTITLAGGASITYQSTMTPFTVDTIKMQATSSTLTLMASTTAVVNTLLLTGTTCTVTIASNAKLTVNSYFDWSGTSNKVLDTSNLGTAVLYLPSSCTSRYYGTGTQTLGAILLNNGTAIYSASYGNSIATGGGASPTTAGSFRNYGLFHVTGTINAGIQATSASYLSNWQNYGTLRVNVTSDCLLTNPLANYGTVSVISGVFRMSGGGQLSSGSTLTSTGAASLRFEGGTMVLAAGAAIGATSSVSLVAGALTVQGDFQPTTFDLSGGTITFAQAATLNFPVISQTAPATVIVQGATVTVGTYYLSAGTLQVTNAASLVAGSLYFSGTSTKIYIDATPAPGATLNVTNYFEWLGTTCQILNMQASGEGRFNLMPNATALINGAGTMYMQATFNNYGTVTYSAVPTGVKLFNQGNIKNWNMWLVTNVLNGGMTCQTCTATVNLFYNYGTLIMSPYYDFVWATPLEQRGNITVTNGLVHLAQAAFQYAGSTIQTSGGGQLSFESTFTQTAGSILNTPGIVFAAGCAATFSGDFLPTTFGFTGGTVNFQQMYGVYNWGDISQPSGGTLNFVAGYGIVVNISSWTMGGSSSTINFNAGVRATIGTLIVGGISTVVSVASPTVPHSYALLNISKYFEWGGSGCHVQDPNGNSVQSSQLTINAGARALINAVGSNWLYATLTNYGTVNLATPTGGAGLRVFYYGNVKNYGTWNVIGSSTYMMANPTNYNNFFYNWGLLRINTTVDFTMNANLDNRGTVTSIQGTFRLQNGGTMYSGSSMSTDGGYVSSEAGTLVHNVGATFSSGNGFIFTGSSVNNMYGSVTVDTFSVSGSTTVTFYQQGQQYSLPSLYQNGGTVRFNMPLGSVHIGVLTLDGSSAKFGVDSGCQATIDSLYMIGSTCYLIVNQNTAPSSINVTSYFEWTGTQNYILDEGAVGTGTFTLMPTALGYFAGTGANQYQCVTFINYGVVQYLVNHIFGLRLRDRGTFRNYGSWIVGGTSQMGMTAWSTTYSNVFYNWGTLTVNVTSDYQMNAQLDQRGTVNVIQGNFRPQGSGTTYAGAIWKHSDGAGIQFETGTFTFQPSSMVANGYGVNFASGTVYMAGTFVPNYFQVTGGTVYFQEPGTVYNFPAVVQTGGTVWFKSPGGSVTVNSYVVQGSGGLLGVDSGMQMTVDSLYLNGSSCFVAIPSSTPVSMLNVTTYFEWSGTSNQLVDATNTGTGSLNIMPNARALISGGATNQFLQVKLINYGTVNYQAASPGIRNYYYGYVQNYGTWISNGVQTSMTIASPAYVPNFQNWGTILSNVSDYFNTNAFLDQRGTVNVLQGTFRLQTGGTALTGTTMRTSSAGVLEFNAGTFTLNQGATITAPSVVSFTGGTIQIGGNFLPNNFNLAGSPTVYFSTQNQAYSFPAIAHPSGTVIFNGNGQSLTAGSWNFAGSGAGILSLGASMQATIGTLYLTSTAGCYVQLASGTVLNISSSVEWTGPCYFYDTSGNGRVTIQEQAAVNLYGPSATYSTYTNMVNFGTFNLGVTGVSTSGFRLQAGGQLNNMASGTVMVTSYNGNTNAFMTAVGAANVFNNYGTLAVYVATGYSFLMYSLTYTNYGITDVRRGLLDIQTTSKFMAGSTYTHFAAGTMRLATSTIYAGSNFKVGSSLTFNGAVSVLAPLVQNSVQVTAGTTTVAGGGTVGGFLLSGSTPTLTVPSGAPSITFGLNFTVGTLNVNAPVVITWLDQSVSTATTNIAIGNRNTPATIQTLVLGRATSVTNFNLQANSAVNVQNMLLQAYAALNIVATGYFSVAGSFLWTANAASTIAGTGTLTLLPTAKSTIATAGTGMTINGVLENNGVLSYQPTGTAGVSFLNAASTIRNMPGATINVNGAATTYLNPTASPTYAIPNMGTININLGAAMDFIVGAVINNTGNINVNTGNMKPFSIQQRGGVLTVLSKLYSAPNTAVTSISGWAGATNLLHYGGYVQGTGQIFGLTAHSGGSIYPGIGKPAGLGTVGTLNLEAYQVTSSNAYVEIALLSPGVSAHLAVTGAVTIIGAGSVNGIVKAVSSCPYYPAAGNTFTNVLTWSTRSGTFLTTVFGESGVTLAPTYNTNSLDLQITGVSAGSGYSCSGGCVHGVCCPTDVCNCLANWTGLQCDQPLCGDGVTIGTETCDDGNQFSGDGCSNTCQIESGYNCTTNVQPSVCVAACGNGIVSGTEACDDGNRVAGDGCDPTCQVETGWMCSGGGPGSCSAVCGDGILRGTEQCDDGNNDAGDGCSSTCRIEFGWTCINTTQPTVCASICGDGLVASNEQCDDGNSRVGDGCSFCTIDVGWVCVGTAPSKCSVAATSAVPATTAAYTTRAPATTALPRLTTASTSTGSSGTTAPPPPPPPPPPYNWTTADECASGNDFAVVYQTVPAFIVSSATGYCSCLNGFNTPGQGQFGGTVTANKVSVATAVEAASVATSALSTTTLTATTVTAQAVSTPLVFSTQPANRFVSTASSGWFYTGESLQLTVFSPTRYRFHFRQMVGNNATAGNLAYVISVSTSSSSYVPSCNTPSSYDYAPAGLWATTSAEWYCTVSGTSSYYMWVHVLSGGQSWAIANENAASRAYSDFHAVAS